MTEDEAKTKWCSMVKYVSHPAYEDVFTNKPGTNDLFCIASDCMAWREDLTRWEAQSGYVAASGYCGLAGKP